MPLARVRSWLALGAVALAVAVAFCGCLGSVEPRLPESVAAAITDAPMRRLESNQIILYYPAARAAEARRFLTHVDACVTQLRLRAPIHSRFTSQKVVLILPELPYNNAFVEPAGFGYAEVGVVPTFDTSDEFSLELGLPPDPAQIACHEVTHYVHFQQVAGIPDAADFLFGQVFTPQLGFDRWFDEGLAVYYETLLQPGSGRLDWPYWHGIFAAGVAGHRLDGGDLNELARDFHGGNYYLIGSEFIGFLAQRYGEDKLWKVIGLQSQSVLFPFGIDLRFRQAFGKTLSTLIDEFAADVRARVPVTERPPEQRVLFAAGESARYARALDGTQAVLSADHDEPSRLRIVAPDGRAIVDRDLTDIIPPRTLSVSAPTLSGGLSFSSDGRRLYFVALDEDRTYEAARLMRFDIPTRTLEVVNPDLRGTGGSVSPDERRYLFARADGDHHDLAELDLGTGAVRVIAAQAPGTFVAQPRLSPDGTRIVATTFDGTRFALALFDGLTGRKLRVLPAGGMQVNDASWADDERIVFLASPTGARGFQVYLQDLRGGDAQAITHAPYLAFAPQAAGAKTLRFLNREGWRWTVDEVALPAIAERSDDGSGAVPPEVAPAPAFAPPAPLEDPRVPILSDEPASSLDHLFRPLLLGPVLMSTGYNAQLYGGAVTGGDRLERHRWAVAGYYQSVSHLPSVSAAYMNRQLAPLTVTLAASQYSAHDTLYRPVGAPTLKDADLVVSQRDRIASLDVTRTFYGNSVSIGSSLIERRRAADPDFGPDRRLAGPYIGAEYAAVESTPYTGTRRMLYASTNLAAYPQEWSSLGVSVLDARAEVAVTTPLPLLRRQTLSFLLTARDLIGADERGLPLLQAGGYPGALLWRHADAPEEPSTSSALLPPGVAFFESLRGFEDHQLETTNIEIAEASYTYNFIIDRGSASTLVLLPAFFVRQLDLNLFGVTARSGQAGVAHEAAGGALILRTAFWNIPLTLTYQMARRLTDDDALTQLVLLSN